MTDWRMLAGSVREIIRQMELWRDHPSRAYDEQADRFWKATKIFAPGKDCPFGIHSEAERQHRWEIWCAEEHEKRRVILEMAAQALENGERLRGAIRTLSDAMGLSHDTPQPPRLDRLVGGVECAPVDRDSRYVDFIHTERDKPNDCGCPACLGFVI